MTVRRSFRDIIAPFRDIANKEIHDGDMRILVSGTARVSRAFLHGNR